MIEAVLAQAGARDIDTRDQRIGRFIAILAALNLPLLVLGLLDLPNSPLALLRGLAAYAFYTLYYLLLRSGRGVAGTYACILVLLVLIGWGIHDTGGALTAVAMLYVLLLIGAATVLGDTRAIDITVLLCIAGYGALALYEFGVVPPPVRLLQPMYVAPNPLVAVSIIVVALVTLVGAWLVMRGNLVSLYRSTAALEQARDAAEASARENAALAGQLQSSNHSLQATEARLRETVEALALPLIPLEDGVALLPLVGHLDERRAKRMVEGLLQGIYEQRARAVVIDITGLRGVDAQSAAALLRAAHAARLLGADIVLSGISAETARALVELGDGLEELRTAGSLAGALRMVSQTTNGQNKKT
jgi:anti-anti-sigma regulatory factor